MQRDRIRGSMRRWLGTGLISITVLIGGILLELAAADVSPDGLSRTFLLFAIVVMTAYATLVFVPGRRTERELDELRQRYEQEHRDLELSLTQLGHGDMIQALEPTEGMTDSLAQSLTAATSSISGLVQLIQNSSVEVATSAMSVRETSAELASGSTQQAAAVVEITATMEELARTAAQIATNASGQAELASKSEHAGQGGAQAVDAAVEGVEAVREKMDVIAGRADTLGNRSREIYQVLELINDIARETHILALNAAIEATAAGEHGDRFGVVAEEVRRLAERSKESVESVRSILDEFSDAIRAVVVATEEGTKASAQVLERSRAASQAIEELREGVEGSAQTAREIKFATQEQQTASDQVVLTLKEVSEVIQRMADGLQQFTGAAERLNQLALSIQLLTQTFRIESERSLKHLARRWADEITHLGGNLEAMEGRLERAVKECPQLELLYLVDPTGTMVSCVGNTELVSKEAIAENISVGQVYDDRPWFQALIREKRSVVTPIYESLITGDKCFSVVVPVFDSKKRMNWILGLDVNVRNWAQV
ncbi:MAG: hypothetical protein GY906_36510 [bacterium]|nr:hypothetical protein [bacterium]